MTVLLLDNMPLHTSKNTLKSDDEKILVKFLPAKVTSTIQPRDQGVISCWKSHCRQNML